MFARGMRQILKNKLLLETRKVQNLTTSQIAVSLARANVLEHANKQRVRVWLKHKSQDNAKVCKNQDTMLSADPCSMTICIKTPYILFQKMFHNYKSLYKALNSNKKIVFYAKTASQSIHLLRFEKR